jgi:DNA-binding NtrC family response regulator
MWRELARPLQRRFAVSGAAGPKPKILIADDEESLLFALGEYLGCCGYHVDSVRTLADAERLLASGGYEAVITDLRFSGPGTTEGLDIVRAARRSCPSGRVVIITGFGTPEVEAKARQLGVHAFLHKPVPLWELAGHVLGRPVA